MSGPPSYSPPAPQIQRQFQSVSPQFLFKTHGHKEVLEALCEIYSILTVLQMIETAYLKDYITDKEKYTSTVLRLLNQYKTFLQTLGKGSPNRGILEETLPGVAVDNNNLASILAEKYKMTAGLAIDRLAAGAPATIEHMHTHVGSSSHPQLTSEAKNTATSARLVAEATGNFITIMDALKLKYRTKTQLHPLLSELVISLNDLVAQGSDRSLDFSGKSKLVNWLIKLNNLGDASITDEEGDAFLHDLDEAYKGFYDSLE